MRSTWIFFGLALVTLVLVMVMRPSVTPDPSPTDSDRESRGEATPEAPDRSTATRGDDTERRGEDRGARGTEEEAATVEPQTVDERPEGGYDAMGQAFHASDDYHAFAEEALEAASEGDAAAQYYLSQALSECRLAVSQFDGEYPDANQIAMSQPVEADSRSSDLMMAQVERCRGFFEEDPSEYGHPQGWLDEAAANGYGPAVMEKGARDFQYRQAGRDSDFDAEAVMETLRGRNPEVLSKAGEMVGMGDGSRVDETAWRLMACKYGRDCSGDADWVQTLCLQEGCPAGYEDAEEALSMMLEPGEMDRARARVEELEQALDEGDFEGLFR